MLIPRDFPRPKKWEVAEHQRETMKDKIQFHYRALKSGFMLIFLSFLAILSMLLFAVGASGSGIGAGTPSLGEVVGPTIFSGLALVLLKKLPEIEHVGIGFGKGAFDVFPEPPRDILMGLTFFLLSIFLFRSSFETSTIVSTGRSLGEAFQHAKGDGTWFNFIFVSLIYFVLAGILSSSLSAFLLARQLFRPTRMSLKVWKNQVWYYIASENGPENPSDNMCEQCYSRKVKVETVDGSPITVCTYCGLDRSDAISPKVA